MSSNAIPELGGVALVVPRTGLALFFTHEGAKVIAGCKYVLRTDVLYAG